MDSLGTESKLSGGVIFVLVYQMNVAAILKKVMTDLS
jgi:hypothetical protein